jgi:hypothetical protein
VLWIGGGLALLLVISILVVIAAPQGKNPPSPGSATFTAKGTGKYSSEVFTLSGGSYKISWQVEQTHMGANVPCSVQADLWNEAGYHQGSLIWGDAGLTAAAGPPDAGQVTVRMPPGRWFVEVDNSCPDSRSSITMDRVGD